jgi:hypothetical protein
MGYHIEKPFLQTTSDAISLAPTEQVEKWALDPNCIEQQKCIDEMKFRAEKTKRQAAQLETEAGDNAALLESKRSELVARRKGLEDVPFDPRTEISADAQHIASRIVTHLWIIFVLLPFVLGLLFYIVLQSQLPSPVR